MTDNRDDRLSVYNVAWMDARVRALRTILMERRLIDAVDVDAVAMTRCEPSLQSQSLQSPAMSSRSQGSL